MIIMPLPLAGVSRCNRSSDRTGSRLDDHAKGQSPGRQTRGDSFKAVLYDAETDTTALRIRLETGRTHQIRVHMAAIGHPVAGDGMYGTTDGLIGRQALHSRILEFRHPITGQKLHFECPIPKDMLIFALQV